MKNETNKRIKMGALAMAGMLLLTPLAGCSKDSKNNSVEITVTQGELYKVFNPGEHFVSVKITDDLRKKEYQHQYYEGYKPVGIAAFTYGKYFGYYDGAIITYVNTVDVKCMLTGKDETGLKYNSFGIPVFKSNDNIKNDNVLNEGEHILTVPFKMYSTKNSPSLEYHEGYECVGIEFNTYGKTVAYVDNGYALYVNTVPVEVNEVKTNENEIKYTFGKPVEEIKKLGLK